MSNTKRLSNKDIETIYQYLPNRGEFNNAAIQAVLKVLRPDATQNQIEAIAEPFVKRGLIERVRINRFVKITPEMRRERLLQLAPKKPTLPPELPQFNFKESDFSTIAPALRQDSAKEPVSLADAIACILAAGGTVVFGDKTNKP